MPRDWSGDDMSPRGTMKVVTKIERVQPVVIGVDARGEPIWEGREMARWQMEMIRVTVDWFGSMFMRWCELVKYEAKMEDFSQKSPILTEWLAKSKSQIEEMKRNYKRAGTRKVVGD